MDGGLIQSTVTYDVDGSHSIAQGQTVIVTHDAGSGTDKPVVDLSVLSGGAFTVDATNGAEAILQALVGGGTATLIAAGGTIDVNCSVSGGETVNAAISNDGSLILGDGLNVGDTVNVTFTEGQLELQQGFNLFDQLNIDDFKPGDTVLLDDFTKGPISLLPLLSNDWTSYSVTSAAGAGGTTDDTITFYNGLFPIEALTLNGVPQGDTVVALPESCNTLIECVCFLAGTHIAMQDSERRVEDLRAGDLVRTHGGRVARVKWVGHRSIDTSGLRQPELAMPVRVTAGAIADGVPHRDLRVTPEHALLVDGHLIPARLLVNGTTIRLDRVASYTFYHVELEQHDILLAEGMGAESYLDTGNRGLFYNHGVVDLFATVPGSDFADDYNALACMKLTVDPAATGAIWQSLAARAAALGYSASLPATTHETDLALFVGGRRLLPVYSDGRRAAFALPAGVASITVASRASMPWAVQPWLDDRRQLGVAIDRIVVRSADDMHELAIDSPAMGSGWWDAETAGARRFRWTDGAAQIALPPSGEPTMLEISLHATALHAVAANAAYYTPVALAG